MSVLSNISDSLISQKGNVPVGLIDIHLNNSKTCQDINVVASTEN